jgi:hypothetical protein
LIGRLFEVHGRGPGCPGPSGFNNYTNDKGEVVGNPDSKISGTGTLWPPTAPGFADSFPKGMKKGMQRGHLLGNQLGGAGDHLRNLVPLYRRANSPTMRDYENQVASQIAAGNTVLLHLQACVRRRQPDPARCDS